MTNMDTPNLETRKGRAQARAQNIAYDVTVNDVRYTWSQEQAERLQAQIPDATERVPFE